MRRLAVAIDARIEVAAALAVSYEKFGLAAANRYRALIRQAYCDLAENPNRPGVSAPPDIPADLRLYPIRHSGARVPAADRVGRPRHVIAFRFDDAKVEIVHLLHDGMDLPARLG